MMQGMANLALYIASEITGLNELKAEGAAMFNVLHQANRRMNSLPANALVATSF